MVRAYSDDLRWKFLSAYEAGDGALEQLANRFVLSSGRAKKISAQRSQTRQAERRACYLGRKPKEGAELQKQVIASVRMQLHLTLSELSAKIRAEASIELS